MFCPLGNHVLRGSGVYITNPRHIRFVLKFFPDYLPSEKVCDKCKQDIGIAYEYKLKRALATRARNVSSISSLSTDDSYAENNRNEGGNTTDKTQKRSFVQSTTSTDDGQPTTSAQAAAKRQRREEHQRRAQQQEPLAVNVQRGARLPHIQPVARRQQFIHANPDIMDIYIKGILGG